jgi:methyl-accepting chemotaxis protein
LDPQGWRNAEYFLREITTMLNQETQVILLVIAGLVAVALLLQAFALLAMFFGLRKAAGALREQFEDIRTSVVPFCKDARTVFVRVAPQIEQTASDLAAVTHALRTEADDVKLVATEIIQSTRRQAERLDGMATTVLDAADRAVAFTSETVVKPMRQITGVLAAIKAVVDVLRSPNGTRPRPGNRSGDPQMFV